MYRVKRKIAFYILLTCLPMLLLTTTAFSAGTSPRLDAPVTDLSGKLPEGGPEGLSAIIQELEADNGPKVKVLLINDPADEALDVFAQRTLALQPDDLRPDALLVISVSPPSARIAVTERAQKLLGGVAVRSIVRESVSHNLRDGYYYAAIENGIRDIEDTLRGKGAYVPAKPAARPAAQSSKTGRDGLVEIPPYAPVTDLTASLAPEDIEGLRTEIAALQQKKGSQIAVLMLPGVKPETIEQFALRTFDAWKLGRKGVDDGVLIVVAKDDRRMRIEVGYGLEGVLTDLIAGRIIDEQMQPQFRKGDFGGGLTTAVQQIIRVIDGEALPPVREEVFENLPDTWILVTSGVIIFLCIVLRFWLPAWLCSLISGLGTGGLVWMNTMPAVALYAGLFSTAMTFILPAAAALGGGGSSSSGGFGGSSGGGSGSSSGGGGGSGGGGASGSW